MRLVPVRLESVADEAYFGIETCLEIAEAAIE